MKKLIVLMLLALAVPVIAVAAEAKPADKSAKKPPAKTEKKDTADAGTR